MYSEILDIIKDNAGKKYTAPENLQNPVEKEAMQSLKDRMSAAANQTFKNLVEKALLLLPESNLVIYAPKGVRFLTPNGQKVRDYFWIQLKDSRRKDDSISISVFAKKDYFGITTEFADDRVTNEERLNYNKIFSKPITSNSFNYFHPRDNRNCTYEEVFQNKEKEKYQISRHIKKNEFQSDEDLVNEIAESIRYLIPIYNNIYDDRAHIRPQDPAEESAKLPQSSQNVTTMQKIFFGAPGTGKSHKIDYNLFKDKDGNPIDKGIKEIPEDRKFRTTFHPDYDYAQFVGAYKPKKEGDAITYSFVPQVFAKAYAAAWKQYFGTGNKSTTENQVYLVIEEINRGNCAQIFGDIFQLLDRDSNGFSQYAIDADCDFANWLETEGLGSDWEKYIAYPHVKGGKIALPPNLNILATMNTSDQSLFPMDSAFKRRFDWEYVPISFTDEEGNEKEAAAYEIEIFDENGVACKREGDKPYLWKDFVEKINTKILDITKSEDKQLGEFFIKPDCGKVISNKRFLGKVMFYLWNEVCKDEHENDSFFRVKPDSKEVYFTFQDLYKKEKSGYLKRFMDELMAPKN